jgi:hypothetical protein
MADPFDKIFGKPAVAVHPKVRYWQTALGAKKIAGRAFERTQVEFWREKPADAFATFGVAKLVLHFLDAAADDVISPEEVEWDEKINDALVRMKVPAVSMANEGERFGMVLKDRLAAAAVQFGDGFFNAVLVAHLKSGAWSQAERLSTVLASLREYQPSAGQQRVNCEEIIDAAIGYCIDALYDHSDYGIKAYSRLQTIDIVSQALLYYLDERFHISSKQQLGW